MAEHKAQSLEMFFVLALCALFWKQILATSRPDQGSVPQFPSHSPDEEGMKWCIKNDFFVTWGHSIQEPVFYLQNWS